MGISHKPKDVLDSLPHSLRIVLCLASRDHVYSNSRFLQHPNS